jgi:hypothetical protein
MTWEITVGKYRLRALDSVSISKSIENLADTAVITLPAFRANVALRIDDRIAEGDPVTIRLGYDDRLETEFKGYLNRISADGGSLKLECEDELYLFRRPLKDEVLEKKSLKNLLAAVVAQTDSKVKIDCDFDFEYEKFTIFKADGLDVLKKIQDETKADVYFADGTLHLHAPYSRVINDAPAVFDFSRNIEKADLKYMTLKHKKIEVEVIYLNDKGQRTTKSFGNKGGVKETIMLKAAGEKEAQGAAENTYARLAFDGYEGGFTAWLIPRVEPCFKIELRDTQHEYKNGVYFVVGTETNFSSAGGARTVKLGRRLG